MTDRTLTITTATMASAKDGTLWLVGQGGEHWAMRPDAPVLLGHLPPAEFVLACAPCETCGDERMTTYSVFFHTPEWEQGRACPDCRIELVVPNPTATSWAAVCPTWGHLGTVALGYAYAVGQPLPIVAFGDWLRDETVTANGVVVADGNAYVRGSGFPVPNITDRLAHYGPPESLVGMWALQLAVTA